MQKWWSLVIVAILFSCHSEESEKVMPELFTPPDGITQLKQNDYSDLTSIEINWIGQENIETTLHLANESCGLRIGANASRDSLHNTYFFEGNQPMDSIRFYRADSCVLYFKPDFDVSCKLKQDSILFY